MIWYQTFWIIIIKTQLISFFSGGFVPKRVPTVENYIPLHGESYYAENAEPLDSNLPEGK